MDKEEWFDEIYLRNYDRLIVVAYRMLSNRIDAEDAVHDAFLLLLYKADSLTAHPNIDGWLVKTLWNLARNTMTKASTRCEIDFGEYIESVSHESVESEYSFEDLLPNGLSIKERQILTWFYKDQLSCAEIAQKLGISTNTCYARLSRARNHCKKLLEEK